MHGRGAESATATQTGSTRLRRARYRVLVKLSDVADDAAPVRRTALVIVALLAIVFALWGLAIYSSQRPDIEFGLSEVVYGTIGLFTANGNLEPVPWPLDIARILAPLSTLGLVTEVVLAASAERLRALAASRAASHLVVVGPQDRAAPYFSAAEGRPELGLPAIHASPTDGRAAPHTLRVPVDGDRGWMRAANLHRARKLVLASGSDRINLERLAAALEPGAIAEGCRVVVEIDELDFARRLAVTMAAGQPERDIEVVCPDETRAAHAVETVMDEVVRRSPPPETTSETTTASETSSDRPAPAPDGPIGVTVVGDGPTARSAVGHLARSLRRHAAQESRTLPQLVVVDPDPDQQRRVATLFEPSQLTGRFVSDLQAMPLAPEDPALVLIDLRDADRGTRLAVEISRCRPEATVWIVSEHPLAGGNDLRHLSLEEVERNQSVLGPFGLIAQKRLTHATPAGATKDIGPDEIAEETRRVRRAVACLIRSGWDVVPEGEVLGPGRARPPKFFDEATKKALHDAIGPSDDHDHLIHELEGAGLIVTAGAGVAGPNQR